MADRSTRFCQFDGDFWDKGLRSFFRGLICGWERERGDAEAYKYCRYSGEGYFRV